MVLRTCGNGGRRKGKENVRNCSGKEEIGALALLIRRSRRSIKVSLCNQMTIPFPEKGT
jgi:hypothetical protein